MEEEEEIVFREKRGTEMGLGAEETSFDRVKEAVAVAIGD